MKNCALYLCYDLVMNNNLGISTNTQLLGVDSSSSLNTSPSASTFLPDQASSTCLLLPSSPSPDYIHPLTPSTQVDSEPAGKYFVKLKQN